MRDFKRKPAPKKGDTQIKKLISDISDLDAQRYGYKSEIRSKVTYYYHENNDPYLDIYNDNEYTMKLMKLLSNCLFEMERAIEIETGFTSDEILEDEDLGKSDKEKAWIKYWKKLEADIERIEAWIEVSENLLLKNNRLPLYGEDLIENIKYKHNVEFEYTHFMPVGVIAYDKEKNEIANISPSDLNRKELKKIIRELKEYDELNG